MTVTTHPDFLVFSEDRLVPGRERAPVLEETTCPYRLPLEFGASFTFAPWRLALCTLALLLCSSRMPEQQDPWVEVGHGSHVCSVSMGIIRLPLVLGLGCHLDSLCFVSLCVVAAGLASPSLCCKPVTLPGSSVVLQCGVQTGTVMAGSC